MAHLFERIGQPERADEFRRKAAHLFERFNDAFWDDNVGFYALALDGNKRRVMSISSNPGHCLWSGIVPQDRARSVVDRLLDPDMLTGFGIRTLSAAHRSFNPYSYQTGSVWPHDNAIVAAGFRRYGFAGSAGKLIAEMNDAACHFERYQVPELYAGLQSAATGFPIQYIGANVPQAWAAGSNFSFLQTLIGFQPDAPSDTLYLDPALPDWLPDLSLMDLRMGRHRFDVRFWRDGRRSHFEVTKGDAGRVVARNCASGPRLASDQRQAEPHLENV
jgi:glycogen debranching enzyme